MHFHSKTNWCGSAGGQLIHQLTSKSLKKSLESAKLKIISSIHRPRDTAFEESWWTQESATKSSPKKCPTFQVQACKNMCLFPPSGIGGCWRMQTPTSPLRLTVDSSSRQGALLWFREQAFWIWHCFVSDPYSCLLVSFHPTALQTGYKLVSRERQVWIFVWQSNSLTIVFFSHCFSDFASSLTLCSP